MSLFRQWPYFVIIVGLGLLYQACVDVSVRNDDGDGDAGLPSSMDGDADSDADSDSDSDADNDADSDADNDADSDADNDVDSDADNDVDSDTDNDVDSDADNDADNDVDSDADNDVDSDVDTDIDADTDTDTDTDVDGDADCGGLSVISADLGSISTVGVLEISGDATGAVVKFGPSDNPTKYEAPVDTTESNNRTLLLGMKQNKTYNYSLMMGDQVCDEGTIDTGSMSVGVPTPSTFNVKNEGAYNGGFLILETFSNIGGWDGAFILDEDGDVVWWYNPTQSQNSDWSRARMDWTGKYMLIGSANYPRLSGGPIIRVKMDGTEEKIVLTSDRHHDFTVIPDDDNEDSYKIATIEYSGGSQNDTIAVYDSEGGNRVEVTNVKEDLYTDLVGNTHANAINYIISENAFTLSLRDADVIIKVDGDTGEPIWYFGGTKNDFPGADWDVQHQHHILPDSILLFNNGSGFGGVFGGGGATVLEYSITEGSSNSATQIMSYTAGYDSFSLGDVKRLPNGNTQVIYSNDGTIQEVNSSGQVVMEAIWGMGTVLGYGNRRGSLYGGPPEYFYYNSKQ